LLVCWQIIQVGEMDRSIAGLVDVLTDDGDGGSRRCDRNGQREGAAVFERDLRVEMGAGAKLRRTEVGGEGETKVLFGCGSCIRAGGCRGEGEVVVENQLLNLVKAGACELRRGVS